MDRGPRVDELSECPVWTSGFVLSTKIMNDRRLHNMMTGDGEIIETEAGLKKLRS